MRVSEYKLNFFFIQRRVQAFRIPPEYPPNRGELFFPENIENRPANPYHARRRRSGGGEGDVRFIPGVLRIAFGTANPFPEQNAPPSKPSTDRKLNSRRN